MNTASALQHTRQRSNFSKYLPTYSPCLKYSFKVLLNLFEYLTNSLLRCSSACLPVLPGMKPFTSLTASNNLLMALAISLKKMHEKG